MSKFRTPSGLDRVTRARLRTILLVDDDPAVVQTISKMLRAREFNVQSAGCATDATAIVLQQAVDLAIVDYRLKSDGNGLDFAHRLRQVRPEVPFFVLSGHVNTELVVAAIKCGAQDVLGKPFTSGRLLDAVRAALAKGAPRRSEWAELAPELSVSQRLAAVITRATSAPADLTTRATLARHAGVSVASFCEWCLLLGIKPRRARDLARLLRAVSRSGGSMARIPSLLAVYDHRTMRDLMESAGLIDVALSATITPADFLRRQQFIPFEHDVVRALLELLNAS